MGCCALAAGGAHPTEHKNSTFEKGGVTVLTTDVRERQRYSTQELADMDEGQLTHIAVENLTEAQKEIAELASTILPKAVQHYNSQVSGTTIPWDPQKAQRVQDEVQMISDRLTSFALLFEELVKKSQKGRRSS